MKIWDLGENDPLSNFGDTPARVSLSCTLGEMDGAPIDASKSISTSSDNTHAILSYTRTKQIISRSSSEENIKSSSHFLSANCITILGHIALANRQPFFRIFSDPFT
jgi:hypothetical protein